MIKVTNFVVPREQGQQRMALCKSCEFYNRVTSQCSKCGCIMKVKTKLVGQVCPIGKWS